ncbi:MAG: tetratricopeptide repeat protein [Armatimonadetes bacterium]|nr:tetratricopeptide repeat protein [Armatimonadota bacterium]
MTGRLPYLLYALFLVAVFLWILSPPRGYDVWFYLTVGREIARTGEIPHHNVFLGTADQLGPVYYIVPEWGAGVLLHQLYQWAGPTGLGLATAGLFAALAGLVLAGCRLAGLHPLVSVAWVGLGMLTIQSRFMLRTVLFTDLMLALLVLGLLAAESRERRLLPWLALPLFLVWTNLHQGVVSGLILLLLWAAGEWAQRWLPADRSLPPGRIAAAFGIAILAVFVRPGGLRFLDYLKEALFQDPLKDVLEWAPIASGWWWTPLGAYLLVLVLAFAGAAAARKLRLPHLLVTIGFVGFAFQHQRALGELMATATPLAAPAMVASGRWLQGRFRIPEAPLAAWLAILALLAGWGTYQGTRPGKFELAPEGRLHPLGVVDYLKSHPLQGQVYNSYEFGSYLAWAGIPPFVHGQTSTYPEWLLQDFLDILNDSPRREELLHRYRVTSAILHYPDEIDAHRNLLRYLREHPDWHLVWFDDAAMLFVRGSPPTPPLTAVDPAAPDAFPEGDLPQAETELKRVLETQPDCVRAWLLLAELELRRGRLEQALAASEEALRRQPEGYEPLLKRGAVHFRKESYDEAIRDLERCVAVAPDSAVARYNLALAYAARARSKARQDQDEEARREFDRAVKQAREALRRSPGFEPAAELLRQLGEAL